jgi:hypothetical protein
MNHQSRTERKNGRKRLEGKQDKFKHELEIIIYSSLLYLLTLKNGKIPVKLKEEITEATGSHNVK